jgi:hypothetical protein
MLFMVSFDSSSQPHLMEKTLGCYKRNIKIMISCISNKNMLLFGSINELKGDIYTKCIKSKLDPNRPRKNE